ncbi:hypothetical protein ACMT4L_13930 [Deinococcus sp. A31D244]|uniref:hypothetical protein n=1 Tax=Deinococcus sp. A31D244 TaxID=3397675 RepID=UPI0039E09B02
MLSLQLPLDWAESVRLAALPADLGALDALHALHALRAGVNVRERVQVLLCLSATHLHRGEGGLAARWADEALALTRSQRLARDLRGEALVWAATAARVEGSYASAQALADAALRTRAAQSGSDQGGAGTPLRVRALLARAAARRLSGDPWGSLSDTHAAQEERRTQAGEVAVTLVWMALDPASTASRAATLAGQVSGALRARLAWTLAEHALRGGAQEEARRWLKEALASPFAQEEARTCPLAVSAAGGALPPTPAARTVQVLTLTRRGLLDGLRFVPVPGDGRMLAVLAFLIDAGPSHWERLADAVLGTGSREALYGQVRHHLSVTRQILGHPGAVTSRQGIVTLDPGIHWSCDALTGGPHSGAWLPNVQGWWVDERRAALALQE